MEISHIKISNFRGIKEAELFFAGHTVIIGDNNVGKSTIFEAIDLVLGQARLRRRPVVDEHDFYAGDYLPKEDGQKRISIDLVVSNLNAEQERRFGHKIEFWHKEEKRLFGRDEISEVDKPKTTPSLQLSFCGWYDAEDDDFIGKTFFTRSVEEKGNDESLDDVINHNLLTVADKRALPFLYLRTLRTGRRALSLEHGSLLDIVLRVKEITPEQMWEKILGKLRDFNVIDDPDINQILEKTADSLGRYLPSGEDSKPQLNVSNLTRENLRQIITAFLVFDESKYAAPYDRQGSGTINMLVLALLSQIADERNVVFAMEEPEIAIPPYTQKQVVHEVTRLASQALFTSHSPYVIEEFEIEETAVLSRETEGKLKRLLISLPSVLKRKHYHRKFRVGLCEALLAKAVLIVEGKTEASALPTTARRLAELDKERYSTLEVLGISTLDADGDTNIAGLADMFAKLGKRVYIFCDHQDSERKAELEEAANKAFIHPESGFEHLIDKNTTNEAKERFMKNLGTPDESFLNYLKNNKGNGVASDFLMQCEENEVPSFICECYTTLKEELGSNHIQIADSEINETNN